MPIGEPAGREMCRPAAISLDALFGLVDNADVKPIAQDVLARLKRVMDDI